MVNCLFDIWNLQNRDNIQHIFSIVWRRHFQDCWTVLLWKWSWWKYYNYCWALCSRTAELHASTVVLTLTLSNSNKMEWQHTLLDTVWMWSSISSIKLFHVLETSCGQHNCQTSMYQTSFCGDNWTNEYIHRTRPHTTQDLKHAIQDEIALMNQDQNLLHSVFDNFVDCL
jgi:hypothetical protein